MWDDVQEEVELELSLLRRLFEEHAALLAGVTDQEPGSTQVLALGAILQSFYNGCEEIFKRIAQEIDQEMPSGETWHRDLLASMSRGTAVRPAVISDPLLSALAGYLRFRHAFHHIYTYNLKWANMAPLVRECHETLDRLAAELAAFFRPSPQK